MQSVSDRTPSVSGLPGSSQVHACPKFVLQPFESCATCYVDYKKVRQRHRHATSGPFVLLSLPTFQNTYSIRGYFRPLKRLRLDLQIRNFQSEIHLFATGYLAKLLSVAENLEELCLRLNYASSAVTPFQCSLGGCRFPKLKSFVLVTCHSSFDELLEFLRACPKLERLVCLKHTLVSGQWKEAVKQMRACENLKDVLLDDLRGG